MVNIEAKYPVLRDQDGTENPILPLFVIKINRTLITNLLKVLRPIFYACNILLIVTYDATLTYVTVECKNARMSIGTRMRQKRA